MVDFRSEGAEEQRAKYKDLCQELNMDRETEDNAWQKFVEVSQRFSLDGDTLHWFCCALYAQSRESCKPTVGGSNTVVMGNCVSLNKLLRSCNLSIYEFFSKIKNWQEMANLSGNFLRQIKRLEQTIGTTFNLFTHYNKIFEQLFLIPRNEKRNTKYRSVAKCSSNKLYDLCWCLYLCAKNENHNATVDLITSFHLLICCIDIVYVNVLDENRVDLINPDFEGVPDKWNTPEFDPSILNKYCIIEPLCRLTEAILADAKAMKANTLKPIMEKFFKAKTIYGDENTFLGIVSNQNFERNLKSLNSAYEQYVLSVGEFDETILPNCRKVKNSDPSDGSRTEHHQEMKSLIPDTPYTRKHALPSKDANSEPLANATNSVRKLQNIANITEPSEFLRKAGDNVISKIKEILTSMSNEFHANFPNKSEATKRFQLATSLYYYLAEKILRIEIETKTNVDLGILLGNDILNMTLIACCVELVLDAYNSQLKFPWVLKCFSISAFHFYKNIEMIVGRHDGILTRELIKHLNCVEETCLESLAWQKSSPVWEIIKAISKPLPTYSDVDVNNITRRSNPQLYSPMHPINEVAGGSIVISSDSARRDLFNTAREELPSTSRNASGNRRPGGSLPIFLRKFYKLSWIRIKELCRELDMDKDILLNKIWTLFEYSITHQTELMQDRHLDQILMCAIYLYIKVSEIQGKTFTDIMTYYRKQPQSASDIYREVLITQAETNEANGEEVEPPKYNDIIYFYNNIYVTKMSAYAMNFNEKKKSQHELLLSPHPPERQTLPRKLAPLVYVEPMEKNTVTHSPNHITYQFCKSPAKDLKEMNKIVRGKRNLPFTDDNIDRKFRREAPVPPYYKAVHKIMIDREERN